MKSVNKTKCDKCTQARPIKAWINGWNHTINMCQEHTTQYILKQTRRKNRCQK